MAGESKRGGKNFKNKIRSSVEKKKYIWYNLRIWQSK